MPKNKCQNNLRMTWSTKNNKVMTRFHILKIQLLSLCNKIDCSKQITKKQKLLANVVVLPPTISVSVVALRAVCWEV